jgi:hypothetical protein
MLHLSVLDGVILCAGLPSGLGVKRDDGVEAHAWVESYGRVIVGDGDLDRFEPLEASDPARSG